MDLDFVCSSFSKITILNLLNRMQRYKMLIALFDLAILTNHLEKWSCFFRGRQLGRTFRTDYFYTKQCIGESIPKAN